PFWLLGAAWGLVVARPIAKRARRVEPAARAALLGTRGSTGGTTPPWLSRAGAKLRAVRVPGTAVVGRVLGSVRARTRARAVDADLARELPVVLDLLGVAVGAGCTPYLAVDVAVQWSPMAASEALAAVLRACSLGVAFESAL